MLHDVERIVRQEYKCVNSHGDADSDGRLVGWMEGKKILEDVLIEAPHVSESVAITRQPQSGMK